MNRSGSCPTGALAIARRSLPAGQQLLGAGSENPRQLGQERLDRRVAFVVNEEWHENRHSAATGPASAASNAASRLCPLPPRPLLDRSIASTREEIVGQRLGHHSVASRPEVNPAEQHVAIFVER